LEGTAVCWPANFVLKQKRSQDLPVTTRAMQYPCNTVLQLVQWSHSQLIYLFIYLFIYWFI
jgi:hypothetical protein